MCSAPTSVAEGELRWIAVAATDALVDDALINADIGDRQLIVLRHEGRYHAVARACPHEMADLSRGFVDEGRLHCPRHAASFDLETGAVSFGWTCRPLRCYPLRIADGTILVGVASAEAP